MTARRVAVALMMAGMMLAQSSGCGDSSSPTYTPPPPPPPPVSSGKTVSMIGMAFSPDSLGVAAGTKVIWTNNDHVPHTATSDDGSWDTGIIQPGASDTIAFAAAGRFPYHCEVHPMMVGSVTVR